MEYARLLRNEVQLVRFKESCNSKANEIKKLQTQLAYFKRQAMKRSAEASQEPEEDEHADFANVI